MLVAHAMAASHAALTAAAEAFARAELAGNDGSHSFDHVARVRASALALARQEGLAEAEVEVAELAALLHDVKVQTQRSWFRVVVAAWL